jgi:SAM-dependent methyltransferase
MNSALPYEGNELELFAQAVHWKAYWIRRILPYIGNRVAEVGAGIGSNTRYLNVGTADSWTCIEPDPQMNDRLRELSGAGELPRNVRVERGVLGDLAPALEVDTIVYIDVLEHIEDDRSELMTAASCLVPGGYLIVLAPAHQWLFSAFDRAIGHFRRYSKTSLTAIPVPGLAVIESYYLDSVGLFASLLNRFALRSALPTPAQIRLWDDVLVRLSRFVDPLLGHTLGKTVVAVWRRDGDQDALRQ